MEASLRERLKVLPPAARAELRHVLMLPRLRPGPTGSAATGEPGDSHLRQAPDRLRGGPDAPGGARRHAAGHRSL